MGAPEDLTFEETHELPKREWTTKENLQNGLHADTKMAFGLTNSKMAFGPAEKMFF